MNYIKHLTGFFDKVMQDDQLNPTHISLYVSLFQFWNVQRFKNPISISRDEVMRVSKICSKATYHKCMRDLHSFNYIIYDPSYNPFRGSLVTLLDLELKLEHVQKRIRNPTKKETSPKQEVNKKKTSGKQVLVPSINNTNITNNVNIDNEQKQNSKNRSTDLKFSAPDLNQVADYFKEKNQSDLEAQKFFNYFESNGWKIGGRTPMKNWKAAANNWMLNFEKFNPTPKTPTPDNLHTDPNKDYAIPL